MVSGISPVLDGAPQRSGTQIPACSLQGNVQCTATARACRISRRAPPHFPQRRAELIDPTRCCLSWFGAGPLSPPAGGTSLAGAPASSPRVASPTCGVKETSTRRSTDLALATEIHRVRAATPLHYCLLSRRYSSSMHVLINVYCAGFGVFEPPN